MYIRTKLPKSPKTHSATHPVSHFESRVTFPSRNPPDPRIPRLDQFLHLDQLIRMPGQSGLLIRHPFLLGDNYELVWEK